ncbi:MAG: hypothetical protein LC115_10600 [Bacteroidia bacterium]|nr:hypothetical protein [Bacteroidia bacterium]
MQSFKGIRVSQIFIQIGLSGIFFYSILFIIGSFFLLFGGSVHAGLFWVSAFVTAILVGLLGRKEQNYTEYFLGILGVFILFSGVYVYQYGKLDVSYDGVSYHAQAVIEFLNGWNPYYYKLSTETLHEIWLNHYPIASWLDAALLYAALPSFSGMKSFSMFLPLCAASFSIGVFKRIGFSWPIAILIGSILGFNPVSIYEIQSLYLDGHIAAFWLFLIVLFIWRYRESTDYFFCGILLGSITLIQLKFTGVVFVLMLLSMASLAYFLLKRFELILPILAAGFVTFTVGFWILGYAPYVRNLSEHNHIFYPLMGEQSQAVDIMNNNPAYKYQFGGHSTWYKFLKSYGSYCQHLNTEKDLEWRIPFATDAEEVHAWIPGGWITAGFGPMFSGILLVIIVLSVFQVVLNPNLYRYLLIAIFYLLCVLIVPENWLARYVPYFWYFPWLILAFFWRNTSHIGLKIILFGTLIAGFWNIGHITEHSGKLQMWDENRWWSDYNKIGYDSYIYWGPFRAIEKRMQDHGITFHSVNSKAELPCNKEDMIPLGNIPGIWVCPQNKIKQPTQ